MPDHVARRVFETFFTTKGEKGTGIGVPQVRAFMHHIGGHTTVTSELGRGTTVDLFFPAIKPGDRPSSADCPDAPADLSAASARSEEQTSELQSLMRISYAVFCLKKNNSKILQLHTTNN